jgi:tetratricopeptide (TPR) repeat protein
MIAALARRSALLPAILAFAAAVTLQAVRDDAFPRRQVEAEHILYVRSGALMKRLTLSYDALAADVYWVRAMQDFGGDRLNPRRGRLRYQLLYPLLDLTTTLDPYFNIAYRFGAVFLSEPYPGGPGRPDQAVALLRKGLAAQPQKWQYYHDTAFVYYWHLRDYAAAADWFQRAAQQPGAPNWLRPVAATMLLKGGDRSSSKFLWEQILNSDSGWLRAVADRALAQLEALDRIDEIEGRIHANPLPAGDAYSWEALIRRGVVPGTPFDPARVPLDIDAATGQVRVSPQSPLYPMPEPEKGARR